MKKIIVSLIISFFSFTISACEVIGIGAPIIDLSIPLTEEEISRIPGKRGGASVVDWETFSKIRELGNGRMSLSPGGSASNTLRGLARLGKKCALIGKIGNDEMGKVYLERISPLGIEPRFVSSDTPTAQVICLITPDGERTMRAFPGASTELSGKDLSLKLFQDAKLVHFEGYTLYNDRLTEEGMRLAKASGAIVSFDIGSHEIALKYRDMILQLLRNYVDIAFANEDEIRNLTGCSTVEEGCLLLQKAVSLGIVSVGKNGCFVGHQNQVIHCPTKPVKAFDCTGAGDFFASGFLFGFLNDYSIQKCAEIGNMLGGAVVEYMGADIPEYRWENIHSQILLYAKE